MSKSVLEITDLNKTYNVSGTRALDRATLSFYSGEITSLLGENAAGKTTLMKTIVGIEKPDSGSMLFRGDKYIPSGPSSALEKGIGMVPQSLKVISQLTVFENLLLGFKTDLSVGAINHFKGRIEEVMERYSLRLPLDKKVERLSTGQRQRLEVLRILQNSPDIIIFDEPTTLISETEKEELFETFKRLRAEGKAVIFITHKLREAYSVSDRIYVIRSGAIIGRYRREETSVEELHNLVSGGAISLERVQLTSSGEIVLRVEELSIEGSIEGEEA
ncbi:MAG: ATP-binding cassette domain-containing protein, partial [Kosmotogaceae bacterium]|nr:ATP-binding cassette domain-containing protein [Kosmotogaceae bacterium]